MSDEMTVGEIKNRIVEKVFESAFEDNERELFKIYSDSLGIACIGLLDKLENEFGFFITYPQERMQTIQKIKKLASRGDIQGLADLVAEKINN